MTFQQLKYLLEIYHTGSISRAAEHLFVAQSSLSTAIANLETELGCQLFMRNKNGMTPTVEGLQIIERAKKIYGEYQIMLELPRSTVRRIRFTGSGISPTRSAYLRLLKEYADDPNISFSIGKCNLDESLARVALEETDVAVVLCHEPRILSLEGMVWTKKLEYCILGRTPVVATIGPGHRLYNEENIDYRALESDRLIDETNGTQLYNEYLKGIIHLNPDRAILVDNVHLRRSLITEGIGYTIGYIGSSETTQQCGFRYIPLGDLHFFIVLVTNPAHQIPAEALRYMEILKEEIRSSDVCEAI